MKIDIKRIENRINEIGNIGKVSSGGVTRFPYTDEEKKTKELIINWGNEIGLNVFEDSIGNVIFHKDGLKNNGEVILMGSHIDSVPNGGKYDGVAGIVSYLEIMEIFHQNKIKTKYPLEFIIFVNEEGCRFPIGLMGSSALAGRLSKEDLYQNKDKEGLTLVKEMEKYGYDPDKIMEVKYPLEKVKAYFELHIEQGGVLDTRDIPIGIVDGITGLSVMTVKIEGISGHAGAFPMEGRRDPLITATKIIQFVQKTALEYGNTARGTVGDIRVLPGGSNVIPSTVEFTIDYRDLNFENMKNAIRKITRYSKEISSESGVQCTIDVNQMIKPVLSNDKLIEEISNSAEKLEIPYMNLPSGAGHDAMIIGQFCPMAMIFIRSVGGVSHCPEEYSTSKDIGLGTKVLMDTLLKVAN